MHFHFNRILKFCQFLSFFIFSFFTTAQNTIGLPNINNFLKSSYKAGLQNWDIKQDKNGIIYVANNEGLLTFDGKYWELLPLPNKTIVRSVEVANDNRIYVGGQDEIGYFYPNNHGKLEYYSILNLIPQKDRLLGDIWDIKILNNEIFFRSFNKIIKLNNKTAVVYNAPNEWTFMGISNEKLFVQDRENGIFTFENEIFKPLVLQNTLPQGSEITAFVPSSSNAYIITTLKNGVYNLFQNQLIKISSPTLELVEKYRIYDATLVDSNTIALATSYNGVHIINKKGNLIQQFNRSQGLQNNNVLSIFIDRQKNHLLGLDKGNYFI